MGRREPGDEPEHQGRGRDAAPVDAPYLETRQTWAGALPPPELLARYEEVLPGSAERIMRMGETAITGETEMQRRLAESEIETARNGQALAVLLTLIALACSCTFFALGNNVAGPVFLSVPVLLLIRSFITRS